MTCQKRWSIRTWWARTLILVLLVVGAGTGLPGNPARAGETTVSSATMTGGAGYLSRVGDYYWTNVSLRGLQVYQTGERGIQVDARYSRGGTVGENFTFTFMPPPGGKLAPGTYTGAQRTAFQEAGHPGIDATGEGRGCNSTGGQFTIRDIADDLSRVWLFYEIICDGEGPAFGEIRVNMPVPDNGMTVIPSEVHWPGIGVGLSAGAPVRFFNTGPPGVTVSKAKATGPFTAGDVSHPCDFLETGVACTVVATYTPKDIGEHSSTLTITADNETGTYSVPLSGSSIYDTYVWSTHGETGHPFFAGTQRYARSDGEVVDVLGGPPGVTARAWLPTDVGQWGVQFVPPSGETLKPGTTYVDDDPSADNSGPGAHLVVRDEAGKGCAAEVGNFTVHELQMGYTGKLKRFAATFTQQCVGTEGRSHFFGTFALHSPVELRPMPGLAGTPPEPAYGFETVTAVDGLRLTWVNPATPDWDHTVVRAAPGTVPPSSPTDGEAVYSGRDSTVMLTPKPNTPYAFAVFAVDSEGLVAPAVTAVRRAVTVTLAASKSLVDAGGPVALGGKVTDAATKSGLSGVPVAVYAHRQGTEDLVYIGRVKSSATGAWTLTFRPAETYDYFAYVDGSRTYVGAPSSPVHVDARMLVTASAPKVTGKLGTTFAIEATVRPLATAGQEVQLQRLAGSTWTAVAKAKLTGAKPTSFKVKPSAKGTYSYRVYKAGTSRLKPGTSKTVKITVT